MKNRRIVFGLLALLALLMLLGWNFLATDNQTAPIATTPTKNSGVNNLSAPHPSSLAEAAKPAAVTSLALPKLPPVKAGEASPALMDDNDLNVNDWGDLEFSDGVPMVRTLASGETCIIVPTVHAPGGNGDDSNTVTVSFNMLIESPGSSTELPTSSIEALRGKDVQGMMNAELSSTRTHSGKKIEANPSVVATVGQEVEISMGAPGTPSHLSIRFTPKISAQ